MFRVSAAWMEMIKKGMIPEIEFDHNNIFFRCVEDSSEAIMISEKKGTLVYVNPAWARIYGYSREGAVGQTPRLLHSGMQTPEFYEEMWSAIRDPKKGHWKGELVNRAKDGTLVPVLLTITPFRNHDGEISGYMGIAVDMTQKKELESKVAHQDRLASIGLLASGLAHEIGTPLGVVRGRAEFMMMQAQEPAMKKNLEVITGQIDRISKLIRSLLRVSRTFGDIRLEAVKVQDVVDDVVGLLGQNFRQDNIGIEQQIPEGLEVYADFGRLEQVLLNLIMNAYQATKKAIQEGRNSSHFLRITVSVEDAKVVFSVRDSGCGISPANMKKLFRPFFTTKDVGEGTGLGLAIVSQLVHEMGGTIQVESEVGVGTQFRLTLRKA